MIRGRLQLRLAQGSKVDWDVWQGERRGRQVIMHRRNRIRVLSGVGGLDREDFVHMWLTPSLPSKQHLRTSTPDAAPSPSQLALNKTCPYRQYVEVAGKRITV